MVIDINMYSIPTLCKILQVFSSELSSIESLQEFDLMPTQMICFHCKQKMSYQEKNLTLRCTINGCRKAKA